MNNISQCKFCCDLVVFHTEHLRVQLFQMYRKEFVPIFLILWLKIEETSAISKYARPLINAYHRNHYHSEWSKTKHIYPSVLLPKSAQK